MIPKVELVKVEPTVKLEVSYEDAMLIHALLGSLLGTEGENVWNELGIALNGGEGFGYLVFESGGKHASLTVERVNY